MTRKGRPAAIRLKPDSERLKATLEVLSDAGLMRQIQASRKFYAGGARGLSFEEVFGEPLVRRKPRGRR